MAKVSHVRLQVLISNAVVVSLKGQNSEALVYDIWCMLKGAKWPELICTPQLWDMSRNPGVVFGMLGPFQFPG